VAMLMLAFFFIFWPGVGGWAAALASLQITAGGLPVSPLCVGRERLVCTGRCGNVGSFILGPG
jgi:hypothetical protein